MPRFISTLLLALAVIQPLQAITVTPLTFEQLVDASIAVVYARVSSVRGQWTADRRGIESLVMLAPLRYLKGDLGLSVGIRLPGGEAGGMINVLPGAPVLHEGDLVVLFLESRGPSIPIPVGLTQGVFRVVLDARTGAAFVTPPPLKASAAGRIVRGAADRRPLSLDAFASEVRVVAEGQR